MYGEGNFERPCKYFDALKKQRILLTLLNMKLQLKPLNAITVNVISCVMLSDFVGLIFKALQQLTTQK